MACMTMGLVRTTKWVGCWGVIVALLLASATSASSAVVSGSTAASPKAPSLSEGLDADTDSDTDTDTDDDDYDVETTTVINLLWRDNVSCPQPACICRRVSAGQIVTANCHSFDWGGNPFQGVISALEVVNAPHSDGFFLASHSLASMGLKDVLAVRIVKSSLSVLNETAFAGLDKLEEVDLSDNKIRFPHRNVFRNNTNLETLYLAGNPLGSMMVLLKNNEFFMDIPSLYKLDISRCGIDILKPTTFSRLGQLQNLKLSGNKLATIHAETFKDLPYLENVDLSDNNLYDVSADLFALNPEVSVLNLRNNSLTGLLGLNIPSLEELDLSKNELKHISQTAFSELINLLQLNLSANKIMRIHPNAFANNVRLRKLDLSANDIGGPLPTNLFVHLSELEELSLSDNPTMVALPDTGFEGNFNVLHNLDVSYCELSQLRVDHFKNMGMLEHLNLKGNKLEAISPHVMAELPKLRTLDLSKNKLRTLTGNLFQRNSYLQTLYLSQNPLAIISSNTLPVSIKELDLGLCKLENLWAESGTPERLNKNLTKLTHLNVYGNALDVITIPELAFMKDLTVVDLANNPIDCSNAVLYGVVEWLVKQVISPSYTRGKQIVVENSEEFAEDNLRVRWTAVYNSVCGENAFEERAAAIKKMAVPDVFTTLKDAYNYEDEQDSDEDEDEDDEEDTKGEIDDTETDDDQTDGDEDDDDDDGDSYIDIKRFSMVARDYPLWQSLLISGSVIVVMMSIFMIVAAVKSRRKRQNRYKAPMFRNLGSLPPQHKFAGIPNSFSSTRKDGGFVYKKLYEETTTPNVTPSAPFILRSTDSERV